VIAHRLSTIKHSDLIVVIDDGKIVEVGNHNELIKIKGGTYKNLHRLQMY
jgi:subfamily B ATP-binding cassette protein MsbA